ncbi:hypothetical protein ACFQ8O_12470, partial [Streptomyces coelicoflavus]|uniref:hypothetical protein n=1 Tax=Streptomyces coelicoflavus TaxID=285562 RepID=UPI003697CF24
MSGDLFELRRFTIGTSGHEERRSVEEAADRVTRACDGQAGKSVPERDDDDRTRGCLPQERLRDHAESHRGVRSARGALPVLPPVGFLGPPPEPAVPVSRQRA